MSKVIVLLLTAILISAGCSSLREDALNAPSQKVSNEAPRTAGAAMTTAVSSAEDTSGRHLEMKLEQASAAQAAAPAMERKIIRNAELVIELDAPNEAQRKISAIAETHGGFVVNTEAKLNPSSKASANFITIAVRVPAAQFNAALEEMRRVGGRILHEKVTGQDVTEEYIDLEARLRTQQALEAQILELLKRANKISDALEVQEKAAAVRTEIERLEGRRRFLANQAALSTINITLHTPAPIVIATTAKGFWHEVKQAFGNGVDLASGIVLGLIQFVIVLVPIGLLIVAPLALLFRFMRRRWNWLKREAAPSGAASSTEI